MTLTGFIEEVLTTPYYRRRPREVARYASAKRLLARHRVDDPLALLELLGIAPGPALAGFGAWRPLLEEVVAEVGREPGQQGGVSMEDGILLYGLIRATKPLYIIETGVAAGVSSSFICAALIENGRGWLSSIELPPAVSAARTHADGASFAWPKRGVGWGMPPEILHGIGNRRQLIFQDVRTALPPLLARIPYVDIFFHDDLYTPDHMRWEFEQVWPCLRSGAVLVADDVNAGWIDFCRDHEMGDRSLHNMQRLAALRKP